MEGHRLLILIRGLILVGLLVVLSASLLRTVLDDSSGLGGTIQGAGREPGLRVLLRNRDKKINVHPKVTLLTLQDCTLFAPDAPDHAVDIEGSTSLTFMANTNDGLIITARNPNIDLAWPVRRVLLIPRSHNAPKPPVNANTDEAWRNLDRPDLDDANGRMVFTIGNRYYRGSLDIRWADPKNVYALNNVPMEAYLLGVLQAEMAGDYPREALRAQAVASRSYAYAKHLSGGQQIDQLSFDLYDTVLDQEYASANRTGGRIQGAVEDTRGQILTVGGVPFAPFFHASSGGQLASVADVFPRTLAADNRTPVDEVMISKEDAFCLVGVKELGLTNTHWENSFSISSGQLREILREEDLGSNFPQNLSAKRSPGGRITEVDITFFDRTITVPSQKFRMLVNPQKLKSTLWDAESPKKTDNQFTITTKGWGHGVGMSQVSAYAMAKLHEYDYRSILNFFFTGSEIIQPW